jgi:Spy/CpxP family protein refolding chaperone
MRRARFLGCLFGILVAFGVGAGARALQTAGSSASQSSSAKPQPNPDAIENDDALGLTQDQKDKIKSIREDAKNRMKDIEKDKTLTLDQQTKKIKQVRKETRAQVFQVLTPEQQKAWGAEQRERRQDKKAAK